MASETLKERLLEGAAELTSRPHWTGDRECHPEAVADTDAVNPLAEKGAEDDGSVRCTCEWASELDGAVDVRFPAVLDPACRVHGAPAGWPVPPGVVGEGERAPAAFDLVEHLRHVGTQGSGREA